MNEKEPMLRDNQLRTSTAERILDISATHDIERRFTAEFPNDPELQSLHCTMLFGLIARDCKIAYVTMNPDNASSRHSVSPIIDITDLLGRVRLAGQIRAGEAYGNEQAAQLWSRMHDTMLRLREIDPNRPELSRKKFDEYLSLGIERNERFLNGEPEFGDSEHLRHMAHDIRTASELIVCDSLDASSTESLIKNSQKLNPDIWNDFSDYHYWRGDDPFRALPNKTNHIELLEMMFNMREANKAIHET